MFPALAIGREDAIPEQRHQIIPPHGTDLKVLELRGENGLNVLGIDGHEPFIPEDIVPVRCAEAEVALHQELRELHGGIGFDALADTVDAEGEFVGHHPRRLAAEAGGFAGIAAVLDESVDEGVEDVGDRGPNGCEEIVVHFA